MTHNITQEKRDALMRKIQALQQKTTENGCSEQEATAAAGTAQRLMDDYGLSLSEIEAARSADEKLTENDFVQTGREFYSRLHHVRFCANGIAAFTNTKWWMHGSRIHYFGFVADVQSAKYLTGVIQSAMDFEWQQYYAANRDEYERGCLVGGKSREVARREFMIGMAQRLRERLNLLKLEHEMEQEIVSGDSRALVVVKNAIVEKAYQKLRIEFGKGGSYSYNDSDHVWAGRRAGDRVNIPHGGLESGTRNRRELT